MDYKETARKLRAKAADDGVTPQEKRALLAKADELEHKEPELSAFTVIILHPDRTWFDNVLEQEWWRDNPDRNEADW